MRDGTTVLLARVDAHRVLVFDPATSRPVERPRAAFEAGWSGRLAASAAKAAHAGSGFGWFFPALRRHTGVLAQTVAVFDSAMAALRGVLLGHTTNRIDVELGARLFDHLTTLPLAWFEARPVGALAARAKELETVRALLTGPGLTVALDVLFTLVFIAVMASFSVALTAIVLATVVGFALIHLVVTPALKAGMADRFTRGADAQAFLVEALHGIETLKATAAEPHARRRWQELLVANTRAAFRSTVVAETTNQAVGFLNKLMTVGILWYGARLVVDGSITAGTLIAFNMMAGRVAAPVLRLTQMWQQVQQGRVAMQKLADVLDAQPEPGAVPGRTPLGPVAGRIEVRGVVFRYGPRAPAALDGVSFAVPAGQVVGVVGMSGSGKSTLVRLLQRLHVPERGTVSIDGVDLAGIDPAWLRPQIGVVPQEVVLFNRSVRENIALSDPGLPMERIEAAARLAGAHDFIVTLPDAYDTVIGERGARLSGGQRQCVALARALVTDPRILILDEATSALDYESEMTVLRSMRRICAGRTVFIIAHRLAALRGVDRIIVLERGRLVEDGTHAALIAARGRYARLHAIQAGAAPPPVAPAAGKATAGGGA